MVKRQAMAVERPDEVGEAWRGRLGPVQAKIDGHSGLGRSRGQPPQRRGIGPGSDRVDQDRRRIATPATLIRGRGENAAPGDLVDGGGHHGDHVRARRVGAPGDLLTCVADLDVSDDHGTRPRQRPDAVDGGQPGRDGQGGADLDPAERR
jgi:hypothetical protein